MRVWHVILLLATVLAVACGSRSLTGARSAAINREVRAFAGTVAHDVTQDGPTVWRRYFADSPAFFMAVDGQMAFPNSASATAGIRELPRMIQHIELQWGDDLRIDPLTPNLAMMASSYHEVQVSPAGMRVDERGFFTGITEYLDGHWQFRNAHWSSAGR